MTYASSAGKAFAVLNALGTISTWLLGEGEGYWGVTEWLGGSVAIRRGSRTCSTQDGCRLEFQLREPDGHASGSPCLEVGKAEHRVIVRGASAGHPSQHCFGRRGEDGGRGGQWRRIPGIVAGACSHTPASGQPLSWRHTTAPLLCVLFCGVLNFFFLSPCCRLCLLLLPGSARDPGHHQVRTLAMVWLQKHEGEGGIQGEKHFRQPEGGRAGGKADSSSLLDESPQPPPPSLLYPIHPTSR